MSEFWKRKLRTCFAKFDFDHDGVVSKKDFEDMAIQFANSGKADKQKTENLKTQFENEYKQIMKMSETGDQKGITEEVFIDSIRKQRYDPELMNIYRSEMHALFDLMNLKCDGYLQEDEYERMLVQIGVQDASFAREAFRAMDVSGEGKLSFDQFMTAYFDFMFSDDEKSPNAFLFGPLAD